MLATPVRGASPRRAIDDGEERARVSTVVVGGGAGRDFLGLNRARHAGSRRRSWPPERACSGVREIHAELRRLQSLVDKTGGPRGSARRWRTSRDRLRAAVQANR